MKISHYITNPNNNTDLQQNNRDELIKNAGNNGGHGSSTANKRPLGTGQAEYDVGRGNARRKSVPRFFLKLRNLQIVANKNFEI